MGRAGGRGGLAVAAVLLALDAAHGGAALAAEAPASPTASAAPAAAPPASPGDEPPAGPAAPAAPSASSGDDGPESGKLADLSLEELMGLETSSGKKPQPWSQVPAALTVITGEDVHRTGVRSLADALRLAPGTQVARIDANKWAVGVRGFASRLSRSTLVLIDGRPVYSPLFAGTYWEAQDVLLEDLDRIEVVRGPGGALYGANAVNGVINITTKSTRRTLGLFAEAGAGIEEEAFAGVRYGGRIAPELTYRLYAKGFRRDSMDHPRGIDDFDEWQQGQTGLRFDWDASERDLVTVQGDIYTGRAGQHTDFATYVPPAEQFSESDARLGGGNVLTRWTRSMGDGLELQVQAFYDHTMRKDITFVEYRDTADIQAQQRFPIPLPVLAQDVIVGAEYRVSSGLAHTIESVYIDPERRTEDVVSGFIQDEVKVVPDVLSITLGSKFEHNDYTGFEVHPSGRIALTPAPRHLIWASASRAMRIPSRIEEDFAADTFFANVPPPVYVRLTGDGHFKAEELIAYECGYRFQPLDALVLDLALFHNQYRDLLGPVIGAPFVETPADEPARVIFPAFFRNVNDGKTDGVELGADVTITEWWQLHGAYSFLYMDITGPNADNVDDTEGGSPAHQVALRSYLDLPGDVALDATFRFVDRLPDQNINAYATLDARLSWRPVEHVELNIVGQNLIESAHPEFQGEGSAGQTRVPRTAYFSVAVRW